MRLQAAGILGRVLSALRPKRLTVEMRGAEEPDGSIRLAPVCLVGGQEVDAALVRLAASQQVMGYAVAADLKTLAVLRQGPARLTKRQAAEQLRSFERRGIVVRHEAGGAPMEAGEISPRVRLTLEAEDTLRVRSELTTSDGTVVKKPADLGQLEHDEGWYFADGKLLHVTLTNTGWDDLLFSARADGALSGGAIPAFIKDLNSLEGKLGHVEKDARLEGVCVYGAGCENRATVDGDEQSIGVSTGLVCFAKNRRERALTAEDLVALERSGGCERIADGWIDIEPREINAHRQACKELKQRIGGLAPIAGFRIAETLYALREQEGFAAPWTVCISERVKELHRIIDEGADIEFRVQAAECEGRAIVEVVPVYSYGRFELTHADHLQAAARREAWMRRQNAWIRLDQEACQRIEAAIKRLQLAPGRDGYAFGAQQSEKVMEAFAPLGCVERSPSYEQFLAQLGDFTRIDDVELPASLRPGVTLRPYQQEGFNWLAFLQRYGLNGILADDMGLGKTLQTLAAVQKAKEQGQGNRPSLVICPTSVVNNWQAEAEKFFSNCPVVLYTGSQRSVQRANIRRRLKRPAQSLTGPLVVTSYDIARRDKKFLSQIPWLYVVVDEGHNIKNPSAKRTKAIKAIPGQHKLALTGTPIQNKLEELWSLFDFAMPGFLGTRKRFRDKYGCYGEVNWEAVREETGNLKERIRPFVLRRMKESVAKDLPPKIVVDQKVELSDVQVDLYKRVLVSTDYRRAVDEIGAKGVQRAKVFILKVFTTLRAICNHPALAKEEYQGGAINYNDSGKLECLKEMMEEIVDGEHRVLLFCQSTQMLDIIEGFFRKWQHTFLRLDGNTPPPLRPDLVREFNGNASIQCFLISTRAGGTGLNLTGADTVIFYDHDWNPANDSQAQDRAYRIGQTKPVTVYRLISQGTIEEKILERQELKQTLADEVIGADEGGFKDLDPQELLGLFRLEERKAA